MPVEVERRYRWPEWWLEAVAGAQQAIDEIAKEKDAVNETRPKDQTDHEAEVWWSERYEEYGWHEREEAIFDALEETLSRL